MQRGVIYARYSPGPNQREESIEGQIRECAEYAEKNNMQIVGTYADRSVSGRSDNRVEFQRMLKDAEKGLFDVIIVWKIDRFGRNREEIAVNKIRCRKNGVTVMYAKEHIPEGPAGILLESLLEGLAEYYSAELSEKIVRGLTENALKGKATTGARLLGYKINENKEYEIDEFEAPIIRLIFQRFAGDYNYADIIRELNEKGYKTKLGKPFNKNSLSKIVTNEKYAGRYLWRDIEVKIPAIVSKELFEVCKEKAVKVKNFAPGRGKASVNYLLSGKLFCGHCGSSMNGESGTGKLGTKFYYYKCYENKTKKTCGKKTVKKGWIEKLVAETVYKEVLSSDFIIEEIADAVMKIQRQEHDGSLLASLESQLTDVQKSIKNILKLVEQGMMTSSTHERLLELEGDQDDIAGKIIVEKLKKETITKEQVLFWLHQLKDLDIDKVDGQEKIIEIFVHSVFLFDDNKIVITGNFSDDKGQRKEITLTDVVEITGKWGIGGCSDLSRSAPEYGILGVIFLTTVFPKEIRSSRMSFLDDLLFIKCLKSVINRGRDA